MDSTATQSGSAATLPRCPWHNTIMSQWLAVPVDYRRPAPSGPYQLYRANCCKYGQLFPRPTKDEIVEYYNIPSYYTHTNQRNSSAKEQNYRLPQRILTHLAWRCDYGSTLSNDLATFREKYGAKLLDIGCGSGGLLRAAKKAGFEPTGVEPDAEALKVAASEDITVRPGTAEDLPPELLGEQFDVIVMSHVLEHVLSPTTALQNVRSLLRPGGLAIIETPNNSAIGLAISGRYWPWLDVPRHLNFFTRKSLAVACEAAGLLPRSTSHVGYSRQFAHSWKSEEEQIMKAMKGEGEGTKNRASKRWGLLALTFLAAKDLKYDSVRINAEAI